MPFAVASKQGSSQQIFRYDVLRHSVNVASFVGFNFSFFGLPTET